MEEGTDRMCVSIVNSKENIIATRKTEKTLVAFVRKADLLDSSLQSTEPKMLIILYQKTSTGIEVAPIHETQYAAFADTLETIIAEHDTPEAREDAVLAWSGDVEYSVDITPEQEHAFAQRPPFHSAHMANEATMLIELFQ